MGSSFGKSSARPPCLASFRNLRAEEFVRQNHPAHPRTWLRFAILQARESSFGKIIAPPRVLGSFRNLRAPRSSFGKIILLTPVWLRFAISRPRGVPSAKSFLGYSRAWASSQPNALCPASLGSVRFVTEWVPKANTGSSARIKMFLYPQVFSSQQLVGC